MATNLKVVDRVKFNIFAIVYNYYLELYNNIYSNDYYSNILPNIEEEGFKEDLGVKREAITNID